MIVKQVQDQIIVNTPTCGEIREILKSGDYPPLGIAVAIDIQPTLAHYHLTFDEIYFVLDGEIILQVYDPNTKKVSLYELGPNELCVISKGSHHKIIKTSEKNRLCVISSPPFHADDEHPSDKI